MNIVITSNPVRIRDNIHDYVDNFEIACIRERPLLSMKEEKMIYQCDVWYQDGTEIEEEENDQEFQFCYHPTDMLTTVLDDIAGVIAAYQEYNLSQDEDKQEELNVIVVCERQWNKEAVRYLKRALVDRIEGIEDYPNVLDLYQYLKITNKDDLANILMQTLNTKFVYPEDPVAFGYAVYETLKHYI